MTLVEDICDMKFKKLTIENFKSFQFETEIIFPDFQENRTIFLIGGMNGAGKTFIKEAIHFCLYGARQDEIYKNINRKERAKSNSFVSIELVMELDDFSELIVKRSWSASVATDLKPKDLIEELEVIRDGKPLSMQNKQIWQDYIKATIPQSITQFFFFDGEKIQEIASDDHSEVRLKSSLEAVLGIQYISRLSSDISYIKNEERKGFIEVSDEDLDVKESELKRDKSRLQKKTNERNLTIENLEELKRNYTDIKKRIKATFDFESETKSNKREIEKKRLQLSNRLGQYDNEIKLLFENYLPFSLTGKLFDSIKDQIEIERESTQNEAIRESANDLAKRIVRVVEDPEPIYKEKLSSEKLEELERRILRLLKGGTSQSNVMKVLNLSDRDASKVITYMDTLATSEVFTLQRLLEEKTEAELRLRDLNNSFQFGSASDSESELFTQLQEDMEGFSIRIGRETEQLRVLEDDILFLEKNIKVLENEVEMLYEKHNVSKEKVDFITECNLIIDLLDRFILLLRKKKVHLLQEKTFEMYMLLSSKSGLIKNISIDDKSYEVMIIDRNGHEIKKSSLSAGEKEVFAISLLWGLAQTSQLKLPIIIDTPLSRLDSTHRDNIVNSYFSNAAEQVIILSTDTEIDKEYYRALKPYLSGAASLIFDHHQELTTVHSGYFWEVG